MRILCLLLLAAPAILHAQINRSAKELATEKIKEYVETKLFKDLPYKAISFGELKMYKQPHSDMAWTLEHDFEITETRFDSKAAVKKPYHFYFYLDKRINVMKAECVQVN